MQPGIPLTITFPSPGFFLNDPRLTVWFDGHVVYDGSFVSGFETTFPVLPGAHALALRLTTPLFNREKQYPIAIQPANGYQVLLEYSRFWGNFSGAPRIRAY
jgi:hypothetical protein